VIVSLVSEAEWSGAFEGLSSWVPSLAPMVVVAPHPDDETLGTGGLIAAQRARGVDVTVAAVTDGENAYPDFPGLGVLRRREQSDALDHLGINDDHVVHFELPDSDVASQEEKLVRQLAELVSPQTHLIAPWRGDFHPDHQACGRAAEQVARETGATLTSYFFWTWHFGTPALLQALPLRRFALSPELLRRKTEALRRHRSQLERDTGEPILPESLLGPARRSFEVFAVT